MLVKFVELGYSAIDDYIDEIELDTIPRLNDTILLKDKRFDDFFCGTVHKVIWILDEKIPYIQIYLWKEKQ